MMITPTFKALGALLAYPSPELIAALPEIRAIVLREPRLGTREADALGALVAELARGDLLDLQEGYVALFDRGRRTSLHLFEHVHGDSRERGQAMVDLKEVYAKSGFLLSANELPDFLPVVLEFLSQRPLAEAVDMLGDCAHIVRAIGDALQEHDSRYAAVLAAALAMVGEEGLAKAAPARARAEPATPAEKSLDEDWAEAQVSFGPTNPASCGTARPQQSVVQFTPRRT